MNRSALALSAILLALVVSACGGDPTGPGSTQCGVGPTITVGGTVNGTLQQGDDRDFDGAYLDRYSITLASETSLDISLESTAVDAFLWLLDDEGGVVDGNDDSGEGTNARILETVDPGCYFIEATSSMEGEVGAYTLTVNAT